MPTFEDGETIENPCIGYIIAKNPVCDSDYYGPIFNLAECRLCTFIDYSFLGFFGFLDFMILRTRIHIYIFIIFITLPETSFSSCAPNAENLWCCVIVKLGVNS